MAKVSVIIATYNHAKYLPRAIDSVLEQTYQDFEIIVIDDGSTDNTKAACERYSDKYPNKVKYFYQQNSGPAAARNKGIKKASGEYAAFLDADDLWMKEKLQIQIEFLEKNRDISFVYGKAKVLDESGNQIGIKPERYQQHDFSKLILDWGHFPMMTVVVRKECFDKVGYFAEDLYIMEDIHLWIRISKFFKIHGLDQFLGSYFKHGSNVTLNRELVFKSTALVYQKLLDEFKNEVPVAKMKQKIAANLYQLGRLYLDRKQYIKATRNIWKAILTYPYVWRDIIKEEDRFFKKCLIFIKPYLALSYSFCLLILTKMCSKIRCKEKLL